MLALYVNLHQTLLAYIQVALHNFGREELEAHGLADFDEAEDDCFADVGHRVVQLRCQCTGRQPQQALKVLLRQLVRLIRQACTEGFDAILGHAQYCLQPWRFHFDDKVRGCRSDKRDGRVQRDAFQEVLRLRIRKSLVLLRHVLRVRMQD